MEPNNLVHQKTKTYTLDLVKRSPLSFVRGEGSYLFDSEGRPYLDFVCGVAVNSLGHSHPELVSSLCKQAKTLLHVSNLFHIPEQAELAQKLVEQSFPPAKAFFFNSGAEANEAAFKLCRSYGQKRKNKADLILSLERSFHGRTTAAMCLSGQKKIHQGFGRLLDAHIYLPPNDIEALEGALVEKGKEICAFFIELIQGESGVHPLDETYVQRARKLCREHKVLFVVDEVQTGIGRTGRLFCYEHYAIQPDLMTLAKALGSGIAIGALVAAQEYADCLERGQHGTTLGGNPFAARAALETLAIIERHQLLANVRQLSDYMRKRLLVLQKNTPAFLALRSKGFHLAIDCAFPAQDFVTLCAAKGLLVNAVAKHSLRILPPLNLSKKEAAEGLAIIEEAFLEMQKA